MNLFRLAVVVVSALSAAHDVAATPDGHLRTRLYPEEEKLEDAVEEYFNVMQLQSVMSMPLEPSPVPSANPCKNLDTFDRSLIQN